MTISYSGSLSSLLFRWKGSLWKGVWRQLLIYLTLYFLLRLLYQFGLDPNGQTTFENISVMVDEYCKQFPITFLLGFYISSIVQRWWTQFEWISWPDDVLSILCALIPEPADEQTKLKRHTVARYLNLTAALAFREISVRVRQRFPTIQHLVSAGLMTDYEFILYQSVKTENVRWFLPLQWAQTLVVEHLSMQSLKSPNQANQTTSALSTAFSHELNNFRTGFRKLFCYDWVSLPLVYTQVAALATYGYFAFCLVGRQFLDPAKNIEGHKVDFYIPILTIVQFLFYIGWFKVGQVIMWPFGTDDDDIELNCILDRNIRTSFAMVDTVPEQRPPLVPDAFWMSTQEPILPHTKVSARIKDHPPKLHAYVKIKRPGDMEGCQPQINTVSNSKKKKRKMAGCCGNENEESTKPWRYF